jgi:hypothetical protein
MEEWGGELVNERMILVVTNSLIRSFTTSRIGNKKAAYPVGYGGATGSIPG